MRQVEHLNIELTNNCNQRCVYCFNESGPNSPIRDLGFDDWRQLLTRLAQKGLQSVHFTGGEPLMSRNALQLLEFTRQLGLQTSVLSNGFRLGKIVPAHRPQFEALTVVQISLDAVTAAHHDTRRGKIGAWRDAIAAIKALRRASVPCEISCTVSEENLCDLERIARFCMALEMKLIVRRFELIGRGRVAALTPISEDALRTTIKSIDARYPNVLTSDRYRYVPTSPNHDQDARTDGIVTVLAGGKFRGGPVHFQLHGSPVDSVSELLAA